MILIRTRQGAAGPRYQVIIREPAERTVFRTFRRLADARAWAHKEEQKRQSPPAVPAD